MLPEAFERLLRLLEARLDRRGRKEYIQVLRLLEDFDETNVTAAVLDSLRLQAISFDAVRHLLLCRVEQRPPKLNLAEYPYWPTATVATTEATAYLSLLHRASAAPIDTEVCA